MHYYQFNIADYRKDTAHLTPIEHYIYRTLIDWYYLDEKPIPNETQVVIRRLGIDFSLEQNLINVLQDFFVLHENVWTHKRINVEIKDYQEQCAKNRANGKLGGRPVKTQVVTKWLPDETENNPTVTLTNNQEPITNNQEVNKTIARKSSLSKLLELGVDEQIARDWLTIRKIKKMPLTDTALDQIKREASKANIPFPQIIEICARENWAGFKSTWEIPKGAVKQEFNMDNFLKEVNGQR